MTQPYPLYPNIRLHPIGTQAPFKDKIIAPLLEPVVYELAVKNPAWTFVEHRLGSGPDNIAHVRAFVVRDNKDNNLGMIEINRNSGSRSSTPWVFEISNKRISQSRERGSSVTTGSPKVALKTVNKYFSPPTINEKVAAAASAASHRVYEALAMARDERDKARKRIKPAVYAFIENNWAQVLDTMKDSDRAVAETIPSLKENCQSMENLLNNIQAKQHLTVLIEDDTYITHDGGTTRTYRTDDLPVSIKINVGLLKLGEKGKPVADIGIRISDTLFVLYKGANNGANI